MLLKHWKIANWNDALIVNYQNSDISQKLGADAIFGTQQVGELPVNVSPSF